MKFSGSGFFMLFQKLEVIMFCIGDKVLCPMHGAGFIENIESRQVGDITTDVYIVRLIGGLKLSIPKTIVDSSHIRAIICIEKAKDILECFSKLETCFDDNWSKRYKENIERIKSGDTYEVARVFKYLCMRNKLKGLSAGERKMYQISKQILLSELSMSLNKEKADVERLLTESLCN